MRAVVLVAAAAAAAALLSFRTVYEPDLGWHLAHGREILAGHLVRTNIFSAGYPDYPQPFTSWLWDAGVYAAWRVGGDVAVQALQAAIVTAAFAFIWLACRTRAAVLPSLAVAVLGFLVLEPRAIPRPHLVSFAGMAAFAWLIERAIAERSARPLRWAVPIAILWSNAHVESVFGVLLLALFGAAEAIRPSALPRKEAVRVLLVAAACAAGVLITPYGWRVAQYLYENVTMTQLVDIAELRPAYLPVYRAFMAYLVICAVLLIAQPRRLTLWEGVVAIAFGALGYRYLRLTPLIFLVTAPMLARRLSTWMQQGLDGRAVLVTALVSAVFLSRVPVRTFATELQAGVLFPEAMFSRNAASFARDQGLSGPLFNSQNIGGWIAWQLYPQARVFQDSRMQAYPQAHFARILEAAGSQEEWDRLVSGVDWAMLSRPRPNQLSGARRFPQRNWATVYWDEAVEILVRRAGRYATLAADREYRVVTPEASLSTIAAQLGSPVKDRIVSEAQRQRSDNAKGFLGAAVLCLTADSAACADVDRLAAADVSLENEARLVKLLQGEVRR
jgi:hypothetical protein